MQIKLDYNLLENETLVAPHPGGQTTYLASPSFEVLFGGSAGPGKTFALVLDALGLQYKDTPLQKFAIHVPEYRAVLFRRQTTQLADIIDECKKYYYEFDARYIAGRKGDPGVSFNFPSLYTKAGVTYKTYTTGARIFLCHLNEEKDKENHHGFEYQFVGFDELTQFLFSQYIYLFSRCRSIIPYLYPRMRSTSNPVGIGLSWVKKRFSPHLESNVLRYFIADAEDDRNVRGIETSKDEKFSLSRIYIPGKLSENLTLMEHDPNYASRIKAMGAKMAKALLESDWNVLEGQFFDMWNPEHHVVKKENYLTYDELNQMEQIAVIDYGSTMVLSLLAKDSNGNVILFDQLTSIDEVRSIRVEKTKKYLSQRGMAKALVLGDTDMWLKDAFDLANQEEPARAFLNAQIRLQKVSKHSTKEGTYRKACNIAVKDALYYEVDSEGKLIKAPKLKVYARCKYFIETIVSLTTNEDDPEDFEGGDVDHWFDSFKMGFMVIKEQRKPIKEDFPEWLKELKKENQKKKKAGFMAV